MDTTKLNKHTARLSEKRNARIAQLKEKFGFEDPVPEGWLTARQIAQRMKCEPRNVLHHAHYWADHGKCEVRKFKTRTLSEWKFVPHYKFDPEVAKALGI